MRIVEWTIWGVAALLTFLWSRTFRRAVADAEDVPVAMATAPMLWVVCLAGVLWRGWSFFHLLWLFPVVLILLLFSSFFPLSLLSYPGRLYAHLCCLGLGLSEEPGEREFLEFVDEFFHRLDTRYAGKPGGLGDDRLWAERLFRKARRKMMRMRVLGKADVDRVRSLLAAKGTKWQSWQYKVRGGSIVIYAPVTSGDGDTPRCDPPRHRMAKHLRIVPVAHGPFQLECMQPAARWWAVTDGVGDLQAIADLIANDPPAIRHPSAPPDRDQSRLKYHPPAG